MKEESKTMVPVKPKKIKPVKSGIEGNFGDAVNLIVNYANGLYKDEEKRNLIALSSVLSEDPNANPIDVSVVQGTIPGIGGLLYSAGLNNKEFARILCSATLSLTAGDPELAEFAGKMERAIRKERSELANKAATPPQELEEEE